MNLFINCSPKLNNSATHNLIELLKNKDDQELYLYKEEFKNINVNKFDKIIFCYPLYVDAPPSKLIEYMEYIDDNNIIFEFKKIYVLCNCGFLEPTQNDTSVKIIENFCNKHNSLYMGSFKIGSGSIVGFCNINKLYKILSIDYIKKNKKFKKCIENGEKIELLTHIKPMTKRLYIIFANKSWKKKRKLNGLSKRTI